MPETTISTALAQDRLLEAIAAFEAETPGGLDAMQLGMWATVRLTRNAGHDSIAVVWQHFIDLIAAVERDLQERTTK